MAKKHIVGEDGKKYVMKEKKPFYKKWWFIVIVAFVVIGFIGSLGGGSDKETTKEKDAPQSSVATNTEKVETKKEVAEPKKDDVPMEFKSALKKAETYSSMMSMSKASIYDQLTSEHGEKFSPEAGQYAVDNLKADYNENALKKAETYQSEMSMSPDSIMEQLTSEHGEKFTQEEAQYAIDNLSK
ncbi:Ltp family lipoprotein [Vagococcus sp. DIV0080]|uniref:Ltp family lipoprotein n=1 Tax=Candidatus Vagococcus giribetii TaxID=2230876 RepID=A0ABS3HNZ1_9ENTE|nr:Ltp family lipoprotein [Vagococcus sp. DIV0080]MBO0475462.1 Ltp family lipoprotein [Vagococcus sp. DIV0080]